MSTKEKLVVEVLAAHNLMPKDGEGSSSPFVEAEFENQRHRTQVKYKDLNPVWNEKLVFHVSNPADLPYRTLELNVFNKKRSGSSRNFLGKVRVSGSGIAREGEDGGGGLISGSVPGSAHSAFSKKSKKLQQQGTAMAVQQQSLGQDAKQGNQNQKPVELGQGEIKPVVVTTGPGPTTPSANGGGGVGMYSPGL